MKNYPSCVPAWLVRKRTTIHFLDSRWMLDTSLEMISANSVFVQRVFDHLTQQIVS
jgi:hypothetical protein